MRGKTLYAILLGMSLVLCLGVISPTLAVEPDETATEFTLTIAEDANLSAILRHLAEQEIDDEIVSFTAGRPGTIVVVAPASHQATLANLADITQVVETAVSSQATTGTNYWVYPVDASRLQAMLAQLNQLVNQAVIGQATLLADQSGVQIIADTQTLQIVQSLSDVGQVSDQLRQVRQAPIVPPDPIIPPTPVIPTVTATPTIVVPTVPANPTIVVPTAPAVPTIVVPTVPANPTIPATPVIPTVPAEPTIPATPSPTPTSEPSVEGLVTDELTGQPIEGIQVCVERHWSGWFEHTTNQDAQNARSRGHNGADGADGWDQDYGDDTEFWRQDWYWGNCVETDANGNYAVYDLRAGDYSVHFYDPEEVYLSEYHANTTDWVQVTVITVVDDETVAVSAGLSSGAVIRGQVTDGNEPISSVQVKVFEQKTTFGYSWWGWVGDAETDSEGNYEVTGLPAGTYRVGFTTWSYHNLFELYYNQVTDIEQASDVVVTAGQTVSNINATLNARSAIAGTVTDEQSAEPLADVWVCAESPNEVHSQVRQHGNWWLPCDETDEQGNYRLNDVMAGDYVVTFSDAYGRYLDEYYDNQQTRNDATLVTVPADTTVNGIDAALSKGGTITGRVTNSAGEPLKNIAVELRSPEASEQWAWLGWTETDENGQYEVSGLRDGSYVVGFHDWRGGYQHEYYENASDVESATAVTISGQNTVGGINAALGQAGSISGQVTNSAGEPLDEIGVELFEQVDGEWHVINSGYTDDDGNYRISSLNAGNYRVRFVDWSMYSYYHFHHEEDFADYVEYASEYYDNVYSLAEASDVVVTDGVETPNINATLDAGGSISGQVTGSDGATLAEVHLDLFQFDGTDWQWVASGMTDRDGTYEITGLGTGNYRLGAFDYEGRYAYEYYNDASDLDNAADISVTVGQTTRNINIALDSATRPAVDVDLLRGHVEADTRTGYVTIIQWVEEIGDITIERTNVCSEGQTITPQVSVEMNGNTYPMSETQTDSYRVTIPAADVVNGTKLNLSVNCTGDATVTEVGEVEVILYDPSGVVTDADTGTPVVGATVTLYKVPGWQAKTSADDNRDNTCESNLSKTAGTAWSQVAPTAAGIQADPTSGEIDPTINPLTTDSAGYYGWNVAGGCWYVTVSAEGYENLTSPVVGVPPAVTDLNLSLTPAPKSSGTHGVYLPMVIK